MQAGGSSLSNREYNKLHTLYTEFSKNNTAAFGSVTSLQKNSKLPRAKVLQYLHSNPTYTKLRTPVRNFKRLKAVSPAIDEIWSMDLAYVDKVAHHNDKIHYLLVSVDVLSRFLRVEPLVNKRADTAKAGLVKMIERGGGRFPHKIWVDKGSEFFGAFATFCKKHDIIIYSTHSETKSALAERYIRTLKNVLYKYLEHQQSSAAASPDKYSYNLRRKKEGIVSSNIDPKRRYIDRLQDIVKLVNSRVNRSIKMAPAAITLKDTEYLLKIQQQQQQHRQNNVQTPLVGAKQKRKRRIGFKVGDVVRVAKENLPFKKGYQPQYTEELYRIRSVVTGDPVTYALETVGEPIAAHVLGKFYQPELVKFIPPIQ